AVNEPCPLPTKQLASREGKKRNRFDAARQGFANRCYRRQVCGAGEQEAAGTGVLIDAPLDRQEHLRRTLHFIDDRSIDVAYESNRVASGRRERGGIVKSDIRAPLSREPTSQCRLAGLSRTGDRDHASVAERETNPALGKSR